MATGGSGTGRGEATGARVGPACPMKSLFLEVPGDPPVAWPVWSAMSRDHMVAYDLDSMPEVRKVAILRSSLGAEGFKVCMSLCPPDDLTLKEVMDKLQARFAPKVSKIYARTMFHREPQGHGESCLQFSSRLRVMIDKCGYHDQVKDELLRDRFIAGVSSEKIREKLMLESDDITLEQALVIATNVERVAFESKQVADSAREDDSEIRQVSGRSHRRNGSASRGSGRACFACGRSGHVRSDASCPAFGRQCNACHGVGHFAVCCKQKQGAARPGRKSAGTKSSPNSSVKVGGIHAQVGALGKLCGKSRAVRCMLNGVSVCLVCDTGARVSLLNKSTADRLGLTVSNEQLLLSTYTGEKVKVLGLSRAKVQCDDRCVDPFAFVIVPTGANIMGLDLYEELGYKIDIPTCHDADACIECRCLLVKSGTGGTAVHHRFRSTFADLFQQPETLAGFEHTPKVDPQIVPRSQALRRVPIALQEEVSKELARMVSEGILEPIDASKWVSNMVVVPKAAGGVRICCDLTEVNKAVVADRYPLPTFEDLSRDMAGSRYISKLDLKWGYLQVPLDPEFWYLTAMITPVGLFQWTRLPPGLCSAPSCFQKILAIILRGCKGTVHLLDDILVCGKSQREHDERLHEVLCRLRVARVRLNGDRTVLGVTELDFVGLHVSTQSVSPLQSNVDAVLKMAAPTSVKVLKSFLGSVGFYMRFIPDFATTAEPLYELLRGGTPWRWTSECTEAFEALKQR
jgi:hypothetical protein